jgi:hypothetical protein
MILTLYSKDLILIIVLVMIGVLITLDAVIRAIDVVISVISGDASYGDSAHVDVDVVIDAGSGKYLSI